MFEYVVELKQPLLGTTYYRSGHGVFEKNQSDATRFDTYQEALSHIAVFLADSILGEPVEIRIVPAPDKASSTGVK
jgi:hypothetical protein